MGYRQAAWTFVNRIVGWFGWRLVRDLPDVVLHEYESYDEYRAVQIHHNRRKLDHVWADQDTLRRVAAIVEGLPTGGRFGLCHGSRNGFEQSFLRRALADDWTVIGTDISSTAPDFAQTVQWDFHDPNPEWEGRCTFVYTNSLDQSWNPRRAVETWLTQLAEGGALFIEHTRLHGPEGASRMDPFGVRPEVFPYVIVGWFGDRVNMSFERVRKSNMNEDAWIFVIKRSR